MKHRIVGMVLVVALAACGSKKESGGKAEEGGGGSAPAGLWKLAPAEAAAGLVVHEGTIDRWFGALAEVERVANGHPGLAELYAKLRQEIPRGSFDPLDRASVEAFGVDPARGFALFFDEEMEVIAGTLPFASLDTVGKLSNKEPETIDGRKVFKVSGGDVCVDAGGRVMCGRDLATIDAAVAGDGGALAKRVTALPARQRGGIEIAFDTQRVEDLRRGLQKMSGVLRDPGLLFAAADIDGGVLTVRASFQGKLEVMSIAPPGGVPKAFQGLERGAVGVIRFHFDPKLLIAQAGLPPSMPIGGGVDLRRDLIEQLTGDVVMVTRGKGVGGGTIGIGLADASATKKALPAACQLLASQEPAAAIRVTETGCAGRIPLPEDDVIPPELLGDGIEGTIEVRDGALWISVGEVAVPDGAPGASRHTAAMLANEHLIMWGRSLDPLAALPAAERSVIDTLLAGRVNPKERGHVDAVRWALAHVGEIAFGLSEREGWYHGSLVVATHAADPADVYRAYEAAVALDLQGDAAGYRAAMKQLSGKGDTLAANQAELVEMGAPPVGIGSGILAAIAIPAFIKYIRKSKTSEARAALATMQIAADARLAEGGLPASAGPTPPAGACCAGGEQKCLPDPKRWDHPTWKALRFAVADPHYYSYQFEKNGQAFTVRAIGDLDCDGVYSTFEMYGGSEGNPAGLFVDNELE